MGRDFERLERREDFLDHCICSYATTLYIALAAVWMVFIFRYAHAMQLKPSVFPFFLWPRWRHSSMYGIALGNVFYAVMVCGWLVWPSGIDDDPVVTLENWKLFPSRILFLLGSVIGAGIIYLAGHSKIQEPRPALVYKLGTILGLLAIGLVLRGFISLIFRLKEFSEIRRPLSRTVAGTLASILVMAAAIGAVVLISRHFTDQLSHSVPGWYAASFHCELQSYYPDL